MVPRGWSSARCAPCCRRRCSSSPPSCHLAAARSFPPAAHAACRSLPPPVPRLRCRSYLTLGDFVSARFCMEELILLQPTSYVHHLKYAEVLFAPAGLDNLRLARAYLRRACSQAKGNHRAVGPLVSNAGHRRGRRTEATAWEESISGEEAAGAEDGRRTRRASEQLHGMAQESLRLLVLGHDAVLRRCVRSGGERLGWGGPEEHAAPRGSGA